MACVCAAVIMSCKMHAACIGAVQHGDWLSPFDASDEGDIFCADNIEANFNVTSTRRDEVNARLKVSATTNTVCSWRASYQHLSSRAIQSDCY
jgi:hypothetical protein